MTTWKTAIDIPIHPIILDKEGMGTPHRDVLGVEDPRHMETDAVQEGCLDATTALIPVDQQETFIQTWC